MVSLTVREPHLQVHAVWQYTFVVISSTIILIPLLLACSQCWSFFFKPAQPAQEIDENETADSKRKVKLGQRRRQILAKRSPGRAASLPLINEHGIEVPDCHNSTDSLEIQPFNEDYYHHTRSKSLGDRAKMALRAFQTSMVQPDRDEIMTSSNPPLRNSTKMRKISEDIMRHNVGFQEEILGNVGVIYFQICYDLYDKLFSIHIEKATGLEAKDIGGSSDPFVRVMLLPDKKHKMESKVKRKTLNPEWHETLKFQGYPFDVLTGRELYIQVLDYDKFSRPDPIGDIHLKLTEHRLQLQPIHFVEKLRPDKKSIPKFQLGEILLSLSYDQTSGRLTVTVHKCRNLKAMDVTGKCDPYTKLHTYFSGRRVDKRKTHVRKKDQNPEWNETMVLEVALNKVRDVMLVFTVMDFDTMFSNRPVGEVVLGYRKHGKSQQQWTDMLCDNKGTVEVWHTLEKSVKRDKFNARFDG